MKPNLFLHSPENYTHFYIYKEKKRVFVSYCFAFYREVSLSLTISFMKELTSPNFVHPTVTSLLLDLDSIAIRCTKHHYYVFYISYLELESEDIIIYLV